MPTYPYGYGTPPAQLPLHELAKRPAWSKLDAEFRSRLVAMFDAAQEAGKSLGLGGGWRSSALQRQVFLERHYEVAVGGCCVFEGKRYLLKPKNNHAAPPGRSYHEESQPDGDALAADLIGDLFWMNQNCHRFKLVHFGGVNKEPWHVQPAEIPTGRPRYDGAELTAWRPAGEQPTPPPTEDDDMALPIITNAEPFFGAAVNVAKFVLQDNGKLRLLDLVEWQTRGSVAGTPWKNEDIARHGVDS